MNKEHSEDNQTKEDVEKEKKESRFRKMFSGEKKEPSSSNQGLRKKIGVQNLLMILVLGLALIFLCYLDGGKKPERKQKQTKTASAKSESLDSNPIYSHTETETEEYIAQLEKKLEEILSKVNGIGKVKVMITLQESKELVTLKDTPYTKEKTNEKDAQGGMRENEKVTREDETVMSSTVNGDSAPYIIKEIQPVIGGVVVIAEGGSNTQIQVDIVEAVEALFDLPVHKIKVMEMGGSR